MKSLATVVTSILLTSVVWSFPVMAEVPTKVRVVSVGTDHLGKQPSQHVVLQSAGGSEFVQIFPDATHGDCCFRVPIGQVLVVTDVDWVFSSGVADQAQILRVFLNNLANPKLINYPFQSTISLNASGQGGGNQSLTTGFIVSPNARLGYDTLPSSGVVYSVVLRGYLTADK